MMRNSGHDTSSISVPTVGTRGTTMGHGTQKLPGIGDDFVALFALDMADEADTAGVFLEIVQI